MSTHIVEMPLSQILVVDDNRDHLRLLTKLLTERGYLVRPLLDGTLALASVAESLPDLMLLDIVMPGLSGYDLCRQFKANPQTCEIPIIFISELDEVLDKVTAFTSGGVDYITKPFQVDEVLMRVQTHLALRHSQKRLQEKNAQLEEAIKEHEATAETLKRRNRDLRLVNQVGQLFSSSLELPQVLETTLAEIQALLDAFSTSIWLIEDGQETLVCMHAKGPGSAEILHWRLAAGQGITGWALSHRASALVADTWQDARHFREVDQKTGVIIRSIISIPLLVKGRVIGVLNLADSRVGHFTAHDLIMLESIAAEAAIAIENARLYSTAQREIADRRHAEQALTQSFAQIAQAKREWETTADSLPSVICLLDQQRRILRANRTVQAWHLGQVKDVQKQPIHEVFHPHCQTPQCYWEVLLDSAWPKLAEGQAIEYETYDGELQRYVNIQIRPLISQVAANDFPSDSFAVVSIADMTERKQAEIEIQAAKDEAEAANHAKSVFLANMSHELRTPLNAILGFAELLVRNSKLDEKQRESVNIIRRSGEHLLSLINQVLDLSKIESGRMTLDETECDLGGLLRDLESMFSLKAQKKHILLEIEPDPALPQYIRTDEIKLRQVLINLLNNALKFTTAGRVRLHVKRLNTPVSSPPRLNGRSPAADRVSFQFEIADTGPGIASDELDSLFEPFTQTKTGREAHEGTGLGLSISRKFVQLMGGEMAVTSAVGRGTVFTFTVQAGVANTIPAAVPLPPRIIGLSPAQPAYRILIVDDNLETRELFVRLLEPLGFELREAQNGQEAFETWERWQPQLIWMNIGMPALNGYETTRRLKATPQGRATVIIATTANSFEDEQHVMQTSGCDGFLRLPFKENEMFHLMQRLLGLHYIYAPASDQPPPPISADEVLTPDELAGLPGELLHHLEQALVTTDIMTLSNLIEEIRWQKPALADILARFAKNFEYLKILHVLHQIPFYHNPSIAH